MWSLRLFTSTFFLLRYLYRCLAVPEYNRNLMPKLCLYIAAPSNLKPIAVVTSTRLPTSPAPLQCCPLAKVCS